MRESDRVVNKNGGVSTVCSPHCSQLKLEMTPAGGYAVLEDPQEKITGQRFESFEQVMSAMDQGGFGDMLCGLVAEKLNDVDEPEASDG